MWRQIKYCLTIGQLIAAAIQTIVLTLALQILLFAIGAHPPREWSYISASAVGLFLISLVVTVVLGADKRPALIGEIAALSIGEINLDKIQAHVIQENIPKRFCLISPVVNVSNTGTPSIAKGYRLKVIFP